MPALELISFHICPFVQRSAIALQALGVDYDIRYIDLTDKPDWFLEISPRGKVPVLRSERGALFESTPIAEFLNESVGGGALLPADPFDRAAARAWMATINDLITPLYVLSVSPSEKVARDQADKLRAGLAPVEQALGDGPYFMGDALTLVDCVAAPLLQRMRWSQELQPSLELFLGLPKVEAWAARLVAHDAVKGSTVSDIRERFIRYSEGNHGVNQSDAPPAWLVQPR